MVSDTLAILNGHLIDPAVGISGKFDILVEGGLVKKVVPNLEVKTPKIIDADGLFVTPGFIDLHVHLREPGFEYKEDICSGSRAAVAGGFTSVFAMPNTNPVTDNIDVLHLIKKMADKSALSRIFPVGAITQGSEGRKLANFGMYRQEGVIAISDDGNSVQDASVMRAALDQAAQYGLLVISHPEDKNLSGGGLINEGKIAKKFGLKGIPPEAEENIIERDVRLCKETGARLHIAHVSTMHGLDIIRRAKKDGVRVTCEVTPHHITLTEEDIRPDDANTKMNPPLRTKKDRGGLIQGIIDGTVDAIATDHAPHSVAEKADFTSAPFGVIGLETALPVCLELVAQGLIPIERLIELFTAGPARVAGFKGLGGLKEGEKADITMFNPDDEYTIGPGRSFSKSRNTPFWGRRVRGRIVHTIINGRVLFP